MPTAAKIKAAVCHQFGQALVIDEVDLAAPGRDEIEVEVAACAICHSDILYMDGAWGGELPAVYGHEAAGTVRAVGAGVSSCAPGDPVVVTLVRSCGCCFYCAQGEAHICETKFALDRQSPLSLNGAPLHQGVRTGAFAERVVVHQSQAVVIPADVPLDCASLLACGVITGVGAVANTARVRPGASVVVVGTGGVGLNSVQGAKLCGARTIIAVDLSDEKLNAAREFGATDAINSQRQDAAAEIRRLTDDRGADYAFVTVGNARAIEQAVAFIRPGGSVVIVGMTASGDPSSFETVDLASAAQKIIGSKMGAVKLPIDVPRYAQLYRQGRLKLDELISGRYPLADINDAIDSVRRGAALRNVIVF